MYVVSRNMKVTKDLTDTLIENLSAPSPISKSPGFIRREVLINRKAEDIDIIKVLIYWEKEEDLKTWLGSKEHQQGHIDRHKEQKESGAEPINRKALNLTIENFDVVDTLEAE